MIPTAGAKIPRQKAHVWWRTMFRPPFPRSGSWYMPSACKHRAGGGEKRDGSLFPPTPLHCYLAEGFLPGSILRINPAKSTSTHLSRGSARARNRLPEGMEGQTRRPAFFHLLDLSPRPLIPFEGKYWSRTLPFRQFQALLTLFSEFFSPFPRGTCLLSVSRIYLALDEIYHPT